MDQTSDAPAISDAKEQARRTFEEISQSLASTKKSADIKPAVEISQDVQEIARHVVRRGAVVQAEPPPTPSSKPKSANEKRKWKGKGIKRGGGDGGDDGSDSDEEGENRKGGSDGDGVARRRRTEPASAPQRASTYQDGLSPDERVRMENLRNLRALESQWEQAKERRMEHRANRKRKEILLVATLDTSIREGYQRNQGKLSEVASSDEATRYYLYRATPESSQDPETENLEDFSIRRFEEILLIKSRWYLPVFPELLGIHIPWDIQQALHVAKLWETGLRQLQSRFFVEGVGVLELENMLDELYGHERCLNKAITLLANQRLNGKYSQDLNHLQKAQTYLCQISPEARQDASFRKPNSLGRSQQKLSCLRSRFKDLAEVQGVTYGDAMFERLFWMPPTGKYFTRYEARYVIHLFQDLDLYSTGVFAEEAKLAAQSTIFKEGALWHELQSSVILGSTTQGYKRVMESLFPDNINKNQHSAITNKIHDEDISQEFLQNVGTSEVSIVLFKYQRPFSITRVNRADLQAMGWTNEAEAGGLEPDHVYWRYERGQYEKDFIFKVSIYGEIRDIWTPNGDINWDPSMDSEAGSGRTQGSSSEATTATDRFGNMTL